MKLNNYLMYGFLILFFIDMILTSYGLKLGYEDANILYSFGELYLKLLFNLVIHIGLIILIHLYYLNNEYKFENRFKRSYLLIMITIISFYSYVMLHNLYVLRLI